MFFSKILQADQSEQVTLLIEGIRLKLRDRLFHGLRAELCAVPVYPPHELTHGSNMVVVAYRELGKGRGRVPVIDAAELFSLAVELALFTQCDWCRQKGNFSFRDKTRKDMEILYDVAPAYRKSR